MLKQFIVIITCSFVFLQLTAQQKGALTFDENWQITTDQSNITFDCACFFDEKQKLEGPFECTHLPSGAIVKKYNFKNNILHGIVKEYYTDGTLKLEAEYNEGLPINEWKEYDTNGRLKLHRTFDEESRLTRDYFKEDTPYEKAMALNTAKKEEPPIYTTKCLALNIDEQKYECTEEALLKYFSNPPIPPTYKNDPNFSGKRIECLFQFRINDEGIVDDIEILKSTNDEFLDELVKAHVLNMLPFESAKQYGTPINYWKDGQIIFNF